MRLTHMLSASILAVAAIPAPAFAADWYLGASAGSSSYPGQFLGAGSATASGYDLFAGYRLSPHWALEASHFDMGSIDANSSFVGVDTATSTHSSADTRGFALLTVGNLPFGDTWSAFLTVGAADTRTNETSTSVGTSPIRPPITSSMSASASKWVLSYGAGLQANTEGGWAFRLGWRTLHNVGNTATGSGDIGFLYLSALYTF